MRIVGQRRSGSADHGAAQSRVGGVVSLIQNVIVGAGDHLPHDGGGQSLLDLVGLGLIDESGNRDGLNVSRQ